MNAWDFLMHQKNIHLETEILFVILRFLEGTPIQSLVRKGDSADLALPSTSNVGKGCHTAHIWNSIRLSSIYHGPISGAEDIGLGGSITLVLKGRGREQLYGFYSGGRMPRPWGQPKALPRKRNRHGARTQAPFWSNVYYPFTTCHFWFRNCLWLVFQH